MNIGQRISDLRNNAGLTQEQLAEKLNLSRQSIAKWEKNDSIPDVGNLMDLSSIFGISIDYILKGRSEYGPAGTGEAENLNRTISFLCTAKKNTYAAHGPERSSCRPHSHDLSFEEGPFFYLDSYFGGERFIGEEILYVEDKPFWSMNYAGRTLDDNFSGDFLKAALALVPADKPFRGPEIYQNGNFAYHCHVSGGFEWFEGQEEIYFQAVKVCECRFHGSVIK